MNKVSIYKYFNFSLISRKQIGNKIKERIHITNKHKLSSVAFFVIVFIIFYAFMLNTSVLNTTDAEFDKFIADVVKMFPELNFIGYIYNNYFIISLVGLIITMSIIFMKSKLVYGILEHKKTNTNIYQRELPSKLKPAHARILTNDGLIDEISISATILDLIDKGYLIMEKDGQVINKVNFFSNQKLILSKTTKDISNLLEYEKFLIHYFIDVCGNKQSVCNIELKEKLYNSNLFDKFQLLVIISFPINKFYKKTKLSKFKILYIFLFMIGFTFSIFLSFIPLVNFMGMYILCYSIGSFLFAMPSYVLNQNGADELDSWLDLKKYLVEFSNMKDKTYEMVSIWNFYLTYSIALGIDSVASSEITNFFGNNIFTGYDHNELDEQYSQGIIKKDYYISKEEIFKIEQIINQEKNKYNL